ncbi:hypothetical protein [Paracoccus niistensis]|uniref:Uncharacterized protein n=1 Tax=Paracoccus niistensis TaxID=632935 RepID=A0ABV6I0M7_9RHOB
MGRIEIAPQGPRDALALALAQALGDRAQIRPSALAEALAATGTRSPSPVASRIAQMLASPAGSEAPSTYSPPMQPLPPEADALPQVPAPALQSLMRERLLGRPAMMPQMSAPPEQAPSQAVLQTEAQRTPSRLEAFRQKNPAYANVPDPQLADALHRKFYSDVPRADFDQALGMTPSQPTPDWTAMSAQLDAAASRTGLEPRSLPSGQLAPGAPPIASGAQQLRRFKVQAPSGAVHEVEALDEQAAYEAARQMEGGQSAQGSDYERIMVALRNADAAGDTAAATRLAQMARSAKARQTPQAGGNADFIEVEGPEGTIYEFPAGTDDATIKAALQKVYGAPTAGQGFGNNVAQAAGDGLFFGFGDEISARLNAITGYDAKTGAYGNWGTTYADQLDAVRGQERQFREEHPVISTAAELGGSLIGPAKLGTGFIRNGATGLARIGRSGLVGAATAAGYGFGEGEGGASNRVTQAAVSAPLGAIGGAAIGGLGEGFSAAIGALRSRRMPADTLPTIEGLKAEAGALYEAARQSGAVVPESTVKGMASNIGTKLKAEGFDKMLHPRVNAVLQRLSSEAGDKSLADLEILRRVAAGAANSIEPDERRLASMVLDGIDDAVESMGGDAAPLQAAREVWSRMRRMETIETAIEKASLQDDFASGLRSQFKVLLRNPRRLRGFAEADIAAMRAIAKGEGGAGLLSGLGRRLSPSSITGLALTGGAGFGGAGFGAAAIPAAGMGMKRLGDALTTRAARNLSQRVGKDSTRRALLQALAGPVAPLAPAVVAPGMLAQGLFGHDRR